MKEATALSISGLYFGYYKVQALDIDLSSIYSSIINLSIKNQTPLTQWTKGLSIILEKALGKLSISKLRAILLLEADFNKLYKIIFNRRILPALEKKYLIPYKIVGGLKGQSAIHGALNKKLIADISNQTKCSSVIISTDTINCYN